MGWARLLNRPAVSVKVTPWAHHGRCAATGKLTGASAPLDLVEESGEKWRQVVPPRLEEAFRQMFRGLHTYSVDRKGRTVVPAPFRAALQLALAADGRPVSPEPTPTPADLHAAPEPTPTPDGPLAPGRRRKRRKAVAVAALRRPAVLPERLIVTTGIDPCLVAYTPGQWAAFEARLGALPQFDAAVIHLKRIYVAAATECDLDRQGRILLPPMLRAYAQLDQDMVWAGMVNCIELWAPAAWQARLDAARAERVALAAAMAGLGL